jgi:hypothetical protein
MRVQGTGVRVASAMHGLLEHLVCCLWFTSSQMLLLQLVVGQEAVGCVCMTRS